MNYSNTIYEKNNIAIKVHDKFIYLISVYKFWKNGMCLWKEQYYSSNKPLKINKKSNLLKRKEYKLYRVIELLCAPEDYLIKNNYEARHSNVS